MKKLLAGILLLALPASAASTFDNVVVESTLTLSAEAASRACILDGSKNLTSSSVTSTELSYVSGVTSALQTQLNLKAPLASPALTGNPTAPTQSPGDSSTRISTTAYVDTAVASATIPDATTIVKGKVKLAGDLAGTADLPTVPGLASKEPTISSGTTSQYWRGDKSFQTLDKIAVGLANVDNTSDANKPVSTATQTALNLKEPTITATTSADYYRGDKTFQTLNKTAVGLANVDNTSDADKPVSTATQTALNLKADLASPTFTGVPTAPTAAPGTSTTQVATTAFVAAASASGPIPSAHASSTSVVTSATTTYVTAISTTITVTAASAPVHAVATADIKATTAAAIAKYRVSINGVAGQEQQLSLLNTTDHYTGAAQYVSAALTPGTYTLLLEIGRVSGTGTVNFFQGTLDAVALQGSNSNGITQLTGALQAGPGSGSQALSGTLPIANGGTNQTSAAVNGAVVYSTASAYGYTAAGSSGQLLRSAGAASPTWTTETFPATTTINQILYSSAANVVSGLATANTGALVTSSTGVPSLTSGATANRLLRTNGTTVSFAQANLTTDVTGTLPAANGGTGVTAFASQRVPFGTGTSLTTDANFIYDTTNQRLSVGGSGTAAGNFIVASGSKTALQAFNSSAGNALQATNVSAYTAALISRQSNATSGASIGFEFGRGTPASPTGALNGDQIGVIVATPDAASGSAFGYSGAISFVSTEDATTTATGGDIVLSTTPNTTVLPVEHLRIKQSGEVTLVNSHLKSTQTTPPTTTVQANAGTGATCTVANATDKAGQITVTTGTIGISTGAYCDLNFNAAYGVAPICVLTPASSTLSTSVYVTSTTAKVTVNFGVAGGISSTYLINYNCIETQ